jgi:hypothetical protein
MQDWGQGKTTVFGRYLHKSIFLSLQNWQIWQNIVNFVKICDSICRLAQKGAGPGRV